jgi:hypothetical protein
MVDDKLQAIRTRLSNASNMIPRIRLFTDELSPSDELFIEHSKQDITYLLSMVDSLTAQGREREAV